MSCPFKPGDRVEKIGLIAGLPRVVGTGARGVVIAEPPVVREGHDFVIELDDGRWLSARSDLWKRIDGPTSQSAASFLQSLSKPKVTA